MTLSIVLITLNEEANLPRTLKSVEGLVRDLGGEIIVVDSGSTDRTVEIAKSFGAKVFVEEWKGFAAQKNSAIEKASGEWVLSLDADEEVSTDLEQELRAFFTQPSFRCLDQGGDEIVSNTNAVEGRPYSDLPDDGRIVPVPDPNRLDCDFLPLTGMYMPRRNMFLGRWVKRGGFYPDAKLRLMKRGCGSFQVRAVHETVALSEGRALRFRNALIHHAYPTLSGYIEHMNRYSSLGAEMAGPRSFSFIDIFIRPRLTFFYNYFLRLGFLDGREGFLLHYYHSVYVSWKYAKAWELRRKGD